jgi:hypothetical protein
MPDKLITEGLLRWDVLKQSRVVVEAVQDDIAREAAVQEATVAVATIVAAV